MRLCDNCAFFDRSKHEINGLCGVCRRNCPVVHPYAHGSDGWPTVRKDDWCGQYIVRECGNERAQQTSAGA